ncbi:hypothetical protein [Dyella sp. EPa41]|uniref:hypothetical protein n=1 Tax=Dyella sp. EPa41 TaxID=1561194 RepID=UPI001915690F|nr:hypothetical protein [Dyella sp. EPa41]
MTSKETSSSDVKAKERKPADQPVGAPARNEQHDASAHHPVANQGAPGGTCDDDGDSDNQQDPTRRASAHHDDK